MKTKITEILNKKFNYNNFRSGQKEAVMSALNKKDTLVMLPTGTGKSLCYQLPSYLYKNGLTLIISPLLSLMQDQVESLQIKGETKVVALNSMTTKFERHRIFKNIKKYRFLYTSPEMLQNKKVMSMLQNTKINLFVVDEAHCISHWGTDFRPDYLSLQKIRADLNNPTTMALTATATKQVRSEIIEFLGLKEKQTTQIIESVDREEIKFIVENCQNNKDEILLNYMQQLKGPGIIYFMSKSLADEWTDKLNKEYNIKSASYHSDVETDDKIKIQQQFLNNQIQVICATSAFGMGFDKPDIRFVIHYHLPASPEMYLQEIGRASRDGKESAAILLYQAGDEQIQKYFIENSLPSAFDLTRLYKNKFNSGENEDPIYKLAQYFIENTSHLDEAIEVVKDRKEIKEKQLFYMLGYISTEKCKRDYLLKYFEEQPKQLMKNCCSSCDIDRIKLIEKLNENIKVENYDSNLDELFSWKDIFEKLYKR